MELLNARPCRARVSSTVLLALVPLSAAAQTFSKDIAPILAASCIQCHGHASKMGELDLESREGFLRDGKHGPAVVAGNASESRLYGHLTGRLQPVMPFGGHLNEAQVAVFKAWIDGGAQWDSSGPLSVASAPAPAGFTAA